MKSRRTQYQIYSDIIKALNEEEKDLELVLTHIQFKSNLSYDNLKNYLKKMEVLGLITSENKVTSKGRHFSRDYAQVTELIDGMESRYSKAN